MSRPDSTQSRMRRLVVIFCGFMAAIFAVMLALVLIYNTANTRTFFTM